MSNLLSRILGAFKTKAPEGAYRDGPWQTLDGVLPAAWGKYMNFWQMGYNPLPEGTSAIVEACVSAYAQSVAMCGFNHWRDLENGGRERITTSSLYRIMRQPNDYQTRSDFLLNAVRSLYLDGNAYALGVRNERFEIASLHLMHPRFSRARTVEGEVFYQLDGNAVIEQRIQSLGLSPAETLSGVPARDVFHVKLQTPRDVLHGESPLTAAALAIAAGGAMMQQNINFFGNMSRPSGVLQTDLNMTKTQVDELRDRWNAQSAGLAAGGTPILTSGLKFNPITISSRDAQFAEAMKLSNQQVCEVFRVPLAVIGSEAQPLGSTEALMAFWIANGLGFALNQVELAFDKTFGLTTTQNEYCELDTSILLRSAFKDRIDGLARAVQGGIYSPNEARRTESLPDAEDGDEPRVQQQVVPLSFATTPPPPPTPPAKVDEPTAAPGDSEPSDDATDGKAQPSVGEWLRYLDEAA